MPNNLICPHCHRSLQALAGDEGRELRCPECRQIVRPASGDFTAQTPQPAIGSSPADVQPGLPPAAAPRLPGYYDDDDRLTADIRRREAGEFRSGAALAQAVKILLVVNVLASVALLGSEYLQYELAKRLVARQVVPEVELRSNDSRQMVVGLLHVAVYLVTAIVFLVWFYRAYANLKPLGASGLTFTPGGAVVGWFIPFLNLVRPMQVAQEIWRHSDPESVRRIDVQPQGSSGLIAVWWVMWLASNIISYISGRAGWSVNTPEALLSSTLTGMIAEAVSIPTALLALAVVASIDSRQTARAEAMEATPAEERTDADRGFA
ncbi:MAG: DUF4328 domain-containing protein [Planctomycetes bacterium]|nr:DUF4328 domain-containing protein [Planctomycetota bacterium]